MSQDILIKKLAKFFENDAKHNLDILIAAERKEEKDSVRAKIIREKIVELDKYIKDVIAYLNNSEGVCFGLSVCHGMMEQDERLEWWERGLVDLANWDTSRPDLLDKEINLPNSHESKHAQTQTRRWFYNRVLNYVISTQISLGKRVADKNQPSSEMLLSAFLPSGMTCRTHSEVFKPGGHEIALPNTKPVKSIKRSYFETAIAGQITDIKAFDSISGSFDDDAFKHILNEDLIKGRLCVISSPGFIFQHAIRISYHDSTQQWMLYDPNDDHTLYEKMHFVGTKDEAIKRIKWKFGNEIALTIASTKEEKDLHFPKLSDFKSVESLGSELGLMTMLERDAEQAREFLRLGLSDEKVSDVIYNSFKYTNREKWMHERLDECSGENTFQKIAYQLGDALLPYIEKAENDPKKIKIIADALRNVGRHDYTGFAAICINAPACLKALIRLAKTNPDILNAIMFAAAYKLQDFSSTFSYLAKKNPQCFLEILQILMSRTGVPSTFICALDSQLIGYMCVTPDTIDILLRMAKSTEYGSDVEKKLIRVLASNNHIYFNLAGGNPQFIPILLQYVATNDFLKADFAENLSYRFSVFNLKNIAENHPDYLQLIITLANESPGGQRIKEVLIKSIDSYEMLELAEENDLVRKFIENIKKLAITAEIHKTRDGTETKTQAVESKVHMPDERPASGIVLTEPAVIKTKVDPDTERLKFIKELFSQCAQDEKKCSQLESQLCSSIRPCNYTGLQIVIQRDPELLSRLISFAEEKGGEKIKASFKNQLGYKSETANLMLSSCPELLPQLLKFVDKNSYGTANIAIALRNFPQDKNGLKNMIQSLAYVDKSGKTGWHLIHKHAESYKKNIIEAMQACVRTLNISDLCEIGTMVNLAAYREDAQLRGICKERHSLFRGKNSHGKTKLWRNLMEEIQKTLEIKEWEKYEFKDVSDKIAVQDIFKQKTRR